LEQRARQELDGEVRSSFKDNAAAVSGMAGSSPMGANLAQQARTRLVIPAKAGIQSFHRPRLRQALDPRFRGGDIEESP
jgi:hypothetical protein